MRETLAIIGSGHLGQQIAHFAITDRHYENVVFFDDFTDQNQINGHKVLGGTNCIENNYNKGLFNELIIGIGYKHLDKREELYETWRKTIPFGKIVHSSCWVDSSAKIGVGTVVYPNCCLDANITIGENCIVNISSTIAHDSNIGGHCFLSPGVTIAGFVQIENKCILGISATIIDNIRIAKEIQLGGGTIVIENLIDKGLYVGNPARFIR